ncbi:hypothetical protein TH66_07220 [Carbonactinospora thermoautotrophica]|uniref:Mycothiol-dependent maleylpyruvate isomerase metal-binding domain-containing protein n=2 Tax=Carbonactinospora thermoautotrophica TaxID=1469144 RepID=A0A132N302_9ACTN|nr:maleylpyruvate isomerase family mycothiol-dependent enzyme [Carbonactinospora thermoautotrophica]KWW99916.1 hypothetical protein LI90_1556 [Carbonactinospora thermoautotrophica]KWX04386.1 hypothetical protein TH66_07220 [Carbonactinospora thermoautotrophica]
MADASAPDTAVSAALDDLDPFALLDVESARVDRFFSALRGDGWSRPTRCAGWTVRDLLGHLAAVEEYDLACLDDRLDELFTRAQAAEVEELDDFNAWGVRERAHLPAADLLDRWRADNAEFRRRMRERGRGGTLTTSVGPYPVGLQAFHLACEYATHADDLDAPVRPEEEPGRTRWRARFTRFALRENECPVSVTPAGMENIVRCGDEVFVLTDAELVAAGVRRLPAAHPLPPHVRDALTCLA